MEIFSWFVGAKNLEQEFYDNGCFYYLSSSRMNILIVILYDLYLNQRQHFYPYKINYLCAHEIF